jgi:UDP-N-acetylglucosamine 1-carboxyvinyltransferase
MARFLIEGGQPLRGKVSLLGAKNSSFKLMIAALLSDEESVITNIPQIGDVKDVLEIIKVLGGKVKKREPHSYSLSGRGLSDLKIPQFWGEKSRSSCLFIGPFLARFGQAIFPCPGGDKIGQRPIERHLEGLKVMGVEVDRKDGFFRAKVKKLKGTRYRFAKNTHTGTENLVMAAVLAEGKTVLENAAQEPEIDDLISFLNKMGAKIKRAQPRTIEIEGVKKLKAAVHQVMFDRNEAITFACAALATKGDVLVKNAQEEHLKAFLERLKEIGAGVEVLNGGIRFFYRQPLKATDIVTRPHPGFMTDWQPLWTVLMTQAEGESIISETIFENRFGYVPYLQKMGAKIKFFNPQVKNPKQFYNFNIEDDQPGSFHALRVNGPTRLRGAKISIPDVRAGATLTLAALTAQGKTILLNVDHIDRGYENLDGRLRQLGAKIKRLN